MIQTLCYLLETLLTPENTPPDTAKDIYELYFVFAAIWAFGGFLFKDEVCYIVHIHQQPWSEVTILHHRSSLLTTVWSSPSGGWQSSSTSSSLPKALYLTIFWTTKPKSGYLGLKKYQSSHWIQKCHYRLAELIGLLMYHMLESFIYTVILLSP